MSSKANEAGRRNTTQRNGGPTPSSSRSQGHIPTLSPPTSIPYSAFGDFPGGRQITVVDPKKNIEDEHYSSKSARKLSKVNLVMASVLFLCLLVMAGCLCRPVAIMGGLWVAILVLAQAVLGLHTSKKFRHSLVVGHAWLSGLVCVVCLAAAGYLFTGQMTVACVSTFHRPDQASVVRLYVVEVVSLVASLPCLTAAIIALVSAALAARGACPPKLPRPTTPFVLYLPRWGEGSYGTDQQTIIQSEITDSLTSLPAQPPPPPPPPSQTSVMQRPDRENSPPPSYNQVADESFA